MIGDIDVEVGPHPNGSIAPGGATRRAAVVIDRRSQRAWTGEGWTDSEATTEAVRRFLADRRAKEYVGAYHRLEEERPAGAGGEAWGFPRPDKKPPPYGLHAIMYNLSSVCQPVRG